MSAPPIAKATAIIPPAPPTIQGYAVDSNPSNPNNGNINATTSRTSVENDMGRAFLAKHQWPTGLMDSMMSNLDRVAYRFFIIDDSGSMGIGECKM